MGALGADAAALERLAGSMRTASRQLSEVALGLERRTRATGWTGPDAARFERDWALRHRPALLALAHRSAGLASSLDHQAAEQRRASASSGPPAPPAPVPPTPRVRRPAPVSPFPRTEQRFSGGVGVKVGFVTAEFDGDL